MTEVKTEVKTEPRLEQPLHGADLPAHQRFEKKLIPPLDFTEQQKKMILDAFLNGASPAEAAVLMELARLRHLNPLTRQIHFVKRWDTEKNGWIWAAQVGIDGFRAIAERTGLYDGQDEPEFVYDDKSKGLVFCRVKVYRKDWKRPAIGIAHFSEFAQLKKDGSPTRMWASKPHVMLAKCAEAAAFRKAFPEDSSGLYEEAELGDERELNPAPESSSKRGVDAVEEKVAAKARTKPSQQTVDSKPDAKPDAKPASGPATPPTQQPSGPPTVSFGELKGRKLADLTLEQLQALKADGEAALLRTVNADPAPSWLPKLRTNVGEIDAELAARAKAQASAPPKEEPHVEKDAEQPPGEDEVPF